MSNLLIAMYYSKQITIKTITLMIHGEITFLATAMKKYNLILARSNARNKEALYELMGEHPLDSLILAALGEIMCKDNEVRNGILYLQKAIQVSPSNAEYYAKLGDVHFQLGQIEETIGYYKKAMSLDSNNPTINANYSKVLSRFVPPWHFTMLADRERNNIYHEAIKNKIDENSVVLDIGTGSGLLSLMAAKAGAKKVYTCEQSIYLAEAAKEIIKKNGFEDKITLFNTLSTDLQPHLFDEKPNIIIGEIFDAGLIGEHAIPSFRDAKERLGADNCEILPGKAKISGRLLYAPGMAQTSPLREIQGFDLSIFDQFRVRKEYMPQSLMKTEHKFFSDEFLMMNLNFNNLDKPIDNCNPLTKEITIPITQSGKINGVAFWFQLDFDDNLFLDSEPNRLDNHWDQAVYYFEVQQAVNRGEELTVQMVYNDTNITFKEI